MRSRHMNCRSALSSIEIQVRDIARKIAEDRRHTDILNQIRAVKAALNDIEVKILKDHASHCVTEAMFSGSVKQQKEKFNELIELFGRYKQ